LVIAVQDKAGNTATHTVTFTTATSFADLRDLVDRYHRAGAVPWWTARQLTDRLNRADAAAAAGRGTEAVTHLHAFVNHASPLPPQVRSILIRDAQTLIATITG
jgi:hypothetical protein